MTTRSDAQESIESKDSTVRAIKRALSIMEVLATSKQPIRLSDIARAATLSKSAVHRILTTLVDEGYAARVGAHYTLGPVLRGLAERSSAVGGLEQVLMPFLVRLHIGTRGAASVGVFQNGRLSYSIAVHGWNHPEQPPTDTPPEHTAVGRIFLAYLWAGSNRVGSDQDAPTAAVSPGLEIEATPKFMAELAVIRSRGVAFYTPDNCDGIEIAAPVFGSHNQVIAALQVAGRNGELDLAAAVKHVTSAASKASEYLGQSEMHRIMAGPHGSLPRA